MAKKRSKKPLLSRLAEPQVLFEAYRQVVGRARSDSRGPDGVTVAVFRRNANAQIARLRQKLKDGSYCPAKPRGVPILKNRDAGPVPGNVRPISVYNVEDRVVQRALANLLWPRIRDHVYSDVSFGGIRSYLVRRGQERQSTDVRKNVKAAARRILELRRDGYSHVFETDIKQFFPSIDQERLLSNLTSTIDDDSIVELLRAAVSTTVSNDQELALLGLSEYWDPDVGVPQGGVLSPLLANFYLAPFDKAMSAEFQMVRYVDDLVVLTKSEDEALRAYRSCVDRLSELGLQIHELDVPDSKKRVKSRILDQNKPFDFLGLRFNKKSIHPSERKLKDLNERIRSATYAFNENSCLVEVVGRLNAILRGWMAAYSFCDLPNQTVAMIDEKASDGLARWMVLNGLVKNRNSLNPKKMSKIGLYSARSQQISPISRSVHESDRATQSRDSRRQKQAATSQN